VVTRGDEGAGDSFLLGAAGTPDPMGVGFRRVRNVEVDDMRDVAHIDAPRGDIRGHEDIIAPRAKTPHGLVATGLGKISLEPDRAVARLVELLGQTPGAVLRTREDDGRGEVVVAQEDLIAFFGKVADAAPVPVGIQNAPQFIGIGLSNGGLIELNKRHPNVSILKAEGDAMYSSALAQEASGAFDLFNGRNGVDLIDTLHAGFAGVIPSPDATDVQARVYDLVRAGQQDEAEREFKEEKAPLTPNYTIMKVCIKIKETNLFNICIICLKKKTP